MNELPESNYHFEKVEPNWIKKWEKEKLGEPEVSQKFQKLKNKKIKTYSIVVPPPNITGDLHVGHALDQTIQDLCIRVARMRNYKTLWLPGTDHAGIATQTRIEQELKKENKTRFELGREKFLAKVWEWKKKYGDIITKQQRLLGFSFAWSRERFTMDKGLSEAVGKAFVDLYKKGLIYRATKLINWDPQSQTVLSDLEIEYLENKESELYDFAYKLVEEDKNKNGLINEIVVSTTRPETMLGDTAIAVHPDDERYKNLIGKSVVHPFVDRKIKIIADPILVDPNFGTGAVKLTPAHDYNDYEAGVRHKLEFINIFDKFACINENGGKFKGQDRYKARKNIKEELVRLGLERGKKNHLMSIAISQRTGVVVEPILSTQWFVKTKPLAKKAIEAVKNKKIVFKPTIWTNTYMHWMNEIRDWCISRQLWWGHRIPAWYGPDNKIFVAQNELEANKLAQKYYKKKVKLNQDEDVLDTWFSSALWPFSSLGWAKKTKDLSEFYPTTVLITSYDIIFFWVARMIMFGIYFMKKVPFKTVYIHGLMRDNKGQKMSKTKGNGIDPLKVIKEYGTDAFRFFLLATLNEGKDTIYTEQRLKGYQHFTNKIWNSSRFVLMNLENNFNALEIKDIIKLPLEAEDFWILDRLNQTLSDLNESLDKFKFHLSASIIYDFFWHEFCDWYIEFSKVRLFAAQNINNDFKNKNNKLVLEKAKATKQVLFFVLVNSLKLLHPFMPFISEEIYTFLNKFNVSKKNINGNNKYLIVSSWPQKTSLPTKTKKNIKIMKDLQEIIKSVRNLRAENKVTPDKKIKVKINTRNKNLNEIIEVKNSVLLRLAGASEFICENISEEENKENSLKKITSIGEVYIILDKKIQTNNFEEENLKKIANINKIDSEINILQKRLDNKEFISKAPAAVIEKDKIKLEELKILRESYN